MPLYLAALRALRKSVPFKRVRAAWDRDGHGPQAGSISTGMKRSGGASQYGGANCGHDGSIISMFGGQTWAMFATMQAHQLISAGLLTGLLECGNKPGHGGLMADSTGYAGEGEGKVGIKTGIGALCAGWRRH